MPDRRRHRRLLQPELRRLTALSRATPLGRNGDGNVAFTVTGISGSTSCTATEPTTPGGYTKNETNCAGVSLGANGSASCTIINTLNSATFTVIKDFQPDNGGTAVSFSLSCGANGTVTSTPLGRNGDGNVAFTVTGISGSTSCTATEPTTPNGYTKNETNCASVALGANGTASCTIVNTLNSATFTVTKDFVPDNGGTAVSFSPLLRRQRHRYQHSSRPQRRRQRRLHGHWHHRNHVLHGHRADDADRLRQERSGLRWRRR